MADSPVERKSEIRRVANANGEKFYKVRVDGYADEVFRAETMSKARYRAYRAFCEARPGWSFHYFLTNSHIWATTARHDMEAAR